MGDWSGGDYVNLGPSGAIAAAEYALNRFRELGVSIPPGNRLERARLLLEQVNSGRVVLSPDDENLLRKVAEAQWTAFDFYLIARATGRHMGKEHVEKITMSLGGADVPEDDSNHLPRNTTFELTTAATLAMGGVQVGLDEPDLKALLAGRLVGVAAKRVQGNGKIRRRMVEASEQIERSGHPGIIAVNTDVVLIGTKPIGDAAEKGETINEKLAEVHRADDVLIAKRHVIGRIAFGRTALWSFERERPGLTQDMFRQYQIYERTEGEADEVVSELQQAEETIRARMQQL